MTVIMHDIRTRLKTPKQIEPIKGINFSDVLYADDTLVFGTYIPHLNKALKEIERVGKKNKYICVESYRNEEEKANLLYWQVTCEAFNTPLEWLWWFKQSNYSGDYSFIYFK